jgi:hypothetical protein
MYHYVYKLEHIETKEFYFGSRSCKMHSSLDNYLGSMVTWKPDKTKLKKIVLKDDFKNREDALEFESNLIIDSIDNELNRNFHIPSKGFHTTGKFIAKDENGKCYLIDEFDIRYINGYLIPKNKGNIFVKDCTGRLYLISSNDERYKSGELKKSGPHIGKFLAKDSDGNFLHIDKTDIRFLTGELVGILNGYKHTEETKKKLRNHKGKQEGQKNSQYGKKWIHNIELKQNKKIKKTDEIPIGWTLGRIQKYWGG